jgi:DNA repair exonuclease SbcCD nuclease subunit
MAKIRYLVVSDIHLGHNNTPTSDIIERLEHTVFQEKDIDIIFIAGDLFDRLLDFNEPNAHEVIEFANKLILHCIKSKITLRILEGTPSHDWKQSNVFEVINKNLNEACDFKYIQKLSIEYMEKFNLHILYIPDEWSHDHSDLERQIEVELNRHGIEQVDIAILHGLFNYQDLTGHIPFKFKEEYFLRIVKHYINIGHIHTHSSYDRIIAQGSFDRLRHGEEEDKGYVIMQIDTDNPRNDLWAFRANFQAHIYKSIPIGKNASIERLKSKINKLPIGSYVRFIIDKDHPLYFSIDQLKNEYPLLHFSKKSKAIENVKREVNFKELNMVAQTLTPESLEQKIMAELKEKNYSFTKEQLIFAHEVIDQMKAKLIELQKTKED